MRTPDRFHLANTYFLIKCPVSFINNKLCERIIKYTEFVIRTKLNFGVPFLVSWQSVLAKKRILVSNFNYRSSNLTLDPITSELMKFILFPGGENAVKCTKENEFHHFWSQAQDCMVCICLNEYGLLQPVCASCGGCQNPPPKLPEPFPQLPEPIPVQPATLGPIEPMPIMPDPIPVPQPEPKTEPPVPEPVQTVPTPVPYPVNPEPVPTPSPVPVTFPEPVPTLPPPPEQCKAEYLLLLVVLYLL